MSTRAVIARKTEDGGFAGRYHHFDGYPSGLGAELFALAQPDGPWGGDLAAMLKVLVDDHPAGWSTIQGTDWSLEPGYANYGNDTRRPQCYCHGDRSETAMELITNHDNGTDTEYAYGFNIGQRLMEVWMHAHTGWRRIAMVDLDADEPNWADMEEWS